MNAKNICMAWNTIAGFEIGIYTYFLWEERKRNSSICGCSNRPHPTTKRTTNSNKTHTYLIIKRSHSVPERYRELALANAKARGMDLSAEQRGALEHVTSAKGVSNVIGYAGTGKSAMLGVAREAWVRAGYTVQGAALSGIAAEGLEHGSRIPSRTLASLEHQWAQGREKLTSRHVLVIDEAGMLGTRQMERVISEAEGAGAKVQAVTAYV